MFRATKKRFFQLRKWPPSLNRKPDLSVQSGTGIRVSCSGSSSTLAAALVLPLASLMATSKNPISMNCEN